MNQPRFEISKSKVLEKFDEVKGVADYVSYSSKTNPFVTSILEGERSCYISLHSIQELKNVKDKSKVIFLAQGWDNKEIEYLIDKKINNFVVDNINDLDILKDFLIGRQEKINLFLRLKLKENTLRTEKYFVFGFDSGFINKEILNLKENRNVGKIGIHFHRKTQNISEWNLKREIEGVLEKRVLENLDYLIMGGGLPSVYANTNVKIFNGIFERIKEFKEFLNSFGCKVIIEPGRFIAAPSGKLVSQVKSVYDNNIILNVSVYNADMDALIVPVKLLVEGEVEKREGDPYVVKGVTPCSMDLFRYRVYLKEEPKRGDDFVLLNAGAYNFSSDFCDLPLIESVVVE